MKARHLASYALFGMTGRRHGTRFVFRPEDIKGVRSAPYFKWRNDDCRIEYLEWLCKPRADLDCGHSAYIHELDGRRCPCCGVTMVDPGD